MYFSVDKAKEVAEQASSNSSIDLKTGACLISVTVRGSCGQATIPKSKVELEGEKLESDLLKGTTLQWFPKEPLRFVNRTTQRVAAVLNQFGIAYGKGLTLVPLASLDELALEIEDINKEFQKDLDFCIDERVSILQQHKANNPDVSHLIDRFTLDDNEFRGRFKFKVHPPMAMTPLFDEDTDDLTQEASTTLWDEVAAAASKLHDGSFLGKEKTSQRSASAVKKLRKKLIGLSFLNSGMDDVIAAFDTVIDSLPKTGNLESNDFHRLGHFLLQISDSSRLEKLANGIGLVPFEDEEPEVEIEDDIEDIQSFNFDDLTVGASDDVLANDLSTIGNNQPVSQELDFGFF